jgi:hypothetical protein
MKFLDIIKKYESGLVLEQYAPPPEEAPPATEVEAPEQIDEPAGIATMGNLLKKALTMKISDSDRYKISQLPAINETNASQVIDQLIAIMKTYSVDIDIDNNDKTSI